MSKHKTTATYLFKASPKTVTEHQVARLRTESQELDSLLFCFNRIISKTKRAEARGGDLLIYQSAFSQMIGVIESVETRLAEIGKL